MFIMLLEMADSPDPAAFRQTELFRQCLEMGIIPKTQEDVAFFEKQSSPHDTDQFPCGESSAENPRDEKKLSLHLKISGMWCPACAWYIQTALSKIAGILSVNCQFSTDRMSLAYDPIHISPTQIINSVSKLGYSAVIPGEDVRHRESRREFVRLIISALLTMNIMMLSFSLYSGFMITLPKDAAAKISWPIFIMATIVVFYGGWAIIRRAVAGFTSFTFGMETLVSAGVFSAYGYSLYSILSGSIHLYFDTASMLITLVLLGKMLERKAKEKISSTLDHFLSLKPEKVRLLDDLYPKGRYVSVSHIKKGDKFGVTTGEILPVDGTVLVGTGLVDESTLTGEAKSIRKSPGETLFSGSRIVEGTLTVRADAIGKDSVLSQMTEIMEKTLSQKAAMEGPTEKILQWFVPFVLMLALGTGIYCSISGLSTASAIMRAITVMVISCPCALGIAIPLARVAGVSAAAQIGILIRNFSAFERAEKIDTVVLDKTGTVTKGDWDLLDVLCLGKTTRERALLLAFKLEKKSDHIIADVIKKHSSTLYESQIEVDNISHHDHGVTGYFEGKKIYFGSGRFVESTGLQTHWKESVNALDDHMLYSSVYMRIENEIVAAFVFGDAVKIGAFSCVKELKKQGRRVVLVSGDSIEVTQRVAEKVGIKEFWGEKTPIEKAQMVANFQKKGCSVAMMGDGINDAPAMAQADLSLGIHGKYALAKETADITFMRGAPGQLLDFFSFAGMVRKKIRQNFRFSFFYNIISIPIAMAGLLNPIIAVFAMMASSLTVIGNTLVLVGKTQPNLFNNNFKDEMDGPGTDNSDGKDKQTKRISIREAEN